MILGVGAAGAQSDYRVYIDADDDTVTGCSVSLPGSGTTLDGMDTRLTASRDAGNQITNVTRDTCSGGGFGASVSVGGGYPARSKTGEQRPGHPQSSMELAELGYSQDLC